MGNNSAGSAFAGIVVIVYDLGVLTPKVLKKIGNCFLDGDADFSDADATAKDKLGYQAVVCKVMGVPFPTKPKLPRDSRKWTPEQDETNDDFQEARYDAFNRALKKIGFRD